MTHAQLVLGIDAWGRQAVVEAAGCHGRLPSRAALAALVAVESQTSTESSLEQVALLVQDASAFRRGLQADLLRSGSLAREWSATFPADWLQSQGESLPPRFDELYRHRHAALTNESRLRRKLAGLSEGAERVLLVAAPHEPLAAGVLPEIARWIREEAVRAERPAPEVDLLLALSPLGAAAARAPDAAARLHRALSTLDALALTPDEDPFRHRFVLAHEREDPKQLTSAAVEALGWLVLSALPPAELESRERGDRFRSCAVAWRPISATTVFLDPVRLVDDEARRLAEQTRDRLLGASEGVGRYDAREQVDRLAKDSERGLTAASLEALRRIDAIARTRPDDPRLSPRKIDALAEKLETAGQEARQASTLFLSGGTINRMTVDVSTGWLDRQFEWCWSVVLAGHATLDEVVGWWNVLILELPDAGHERDVREARQRLDESEARRLDGAPLQVAVAAKLASLKAQAQLVKAQWRLSSRQELRQGIGERLQVLLAARGAAEKLPKAIGSSPASTPGPHRARLPISEEELHRSLCAEGLGAEAWLKERFAHRSGLSARALARPLPELVASLRAHVERRVNDFLDEHPICELQGVGPWMAKLVEALPATSERDAASWPLRLRRPDESWTFAGTKGAVALGGSFPGSPVPRAAGDSARLGWLSVGAPLPIAALRGLNDCSRQFRAALAERRLDAGPGSDPAPGDLLERARRELEAAGSGEDWRRLLDAAGAARGDGLLAATAPLADMPRRGAAGTQLGILAEWSGWTELEAFAGLEQSAQEFQRVVEPRGSDVELRELVKTLGALVAPIQKALELHVASERLMHLTAAAEGLGRARAAADTQLAGFERKLLLAVLERWTQLVDAQRSALRGRSELELELRTKRLIASGSTRVVLEVRNRGDHPATAAAAQLLASPAFRVLGEDRVDLGPMPAGDSRRIEFALKTQGTGSLPFEVELAWDDLEAAGKSARRGFQAELVEEPPPFRRIERNPYIAGPPVRSEEMFFGREDIFRYVAENLAGRFQDNILILHGQRRTGKSSILYQLERRSLLPEHVPVLLDLQGLGGFDTAGLLHQLARQAGRRLRKLPGHESLELPRREDFKESCYEAFQEYLDEIEDGLEDENKRLLFMIDEFDVLADRVDRGAVEPEVFPFLRNLMQHRERVAFLLAGTHELLEMRRDYWSILFSLAAYRQVSFLGESEARALIQRPLKGEVEFDDLVVDSLLHLTAGHAYYLQLTCQNLVNHLNQHAQHAWVRPEDLQEVLPEVLEAGTGHFEHEWRSLRSPLGRALLREMATLDDTGLRWQGAGELAARVARLGESDLQADEESVRRALEKLVAGELLEERAGGEAWRIRVDLMRRWIRRRKPALRPAQEAAS